MITSPNLEKSSPFISWMHGMVISSHPGTSRHLHKCCRGVFWSKKRTRLLHSKVFVPKCVGIGVATV